MNKQLHVEQLEHRDVPAATVSTPTEAFSWVLINEMRQDPAGFANQLDALRKGTIPSAFGFSKSDPVVADLNRLLQYSSYPGHYGTALKMLRSTAPLGPFGWDDTLANRADLHTAWMKTHAFEHTGVDDPNKWYVAGFPTSYKGGSPDQWGYSGQYSWWGEDIGYTYGLMANSKAAYSAGQFGRVGFQEREAFIDTVSYVLEVNSPDMAHLEQLIAPDGGPPTGHPRFNAVGVNLEFYEGPNEVRDGLGEATISTHRFGFYQPGGSGGFITGVAYKDANGNGKYDAGEGIGATLQFSGPTSFTETLDRISTQGVSSNYVPHGTYQVTATAADGTPLGTQTVDIGNHNGWFEFREFGSATRQATAPTTSPSVTTAVRPTVAWNGVADAVGYQVRLTNSLLTHPP
ncbi:MAG TPA: CAP domain-containing protein [Gemmataceae bacterium]|nr:CAP domain-containing protein [Gemmataceae bacterium]